MSEVNTKKYYWLKLKDDFFNSREIKKLRKIAGGDTYTIIYLKMQLLSIKKEGLIVYEGTEQNIAEQIALELDEEEDNVKMTLAFLQANKLVEQIHQDEYLLTKVPETIGSETGAAERMRRMRERKSNIVTPQLPEVTNSYTEIEKRREELELEIDNIVEQEPPKMKTFYTPIIEYLNSKSEKSYRASSNKTQDLINARINEGFTLKDFFKVIDTKVMEWKGNDMDKFLRPETLFSNKFEGYLNQDIKAKNKKHDTKFHVEENRTTAYTNNELESVADRKRKEARERMGLNKN